MVSNQVKTIQVAREGQGKRMLRSDEAKIVDFDDDVGFLKDWC